MSSINNSARKGDTIHVVCAADENYGAYAGITVSSVLNNSPGEDIHIHIFSDGIKTLDVNQMKAMARRTGARFAIYDIEAQMQKFVNIPKQFFHLSRTTYCRLFLPDLLPKEISRVIYLDCDVVCLSSLRELWDLCDKQTILGAVRDVWIDRQREHKLSLNMPANSTYYNGGVLLINLDAWRNRNVSKRLVDFVAERGKPRYDDQDAINAVLCGSIAELPRKWNLLVTSPVPGDVKSRVPSAAIIHYCGAFKPWYLGYSLWKGTGAAAFRKAKAASPWRWKLPHFHVARLRRKMRQSAEAK